MRLSKIQLLFFFPIMLNISCSKFLDVTADNQILEENMFKDGSGIRIAVNGVYKLMSTTDLYGKNMTWGFMSCLGYNYDPFNVSYDMLDAAQFRWETANTQIFTEQIWKKAFNALANCNNIIQQVEKRDSSLFTEKKNEREMILGEMYGVRALLHFDLIRLFAPAPVTGYNGEAIPYVNTYPQYQPARLNMETVFSLIIQDAIRAQELLGPIDTVLLKDVMQNPIGRIKSFTGNVAISQGEFFNYRAERMNYFAATALLSRVYLYKRDYTNAYKNARIIYDYHKKNWFQWTSPANQGQIPDVDFVFTKRPDEILLSFANNNNYQNWEQSVNSGGIGNAIFTTPMLYMDKLFEGDMDDFRLVGWYNRHGDQRYLTWSRPKGNSFFSEMVSRNQGPLLPVIRFSEAYHILAECLIDNGETDAAANILNELRINRGAKAMIPVNTPADELMDILVKDIVRETMTEGQTFFMFKRLNRNIFNGASDRIMAPRDWFAPLPLSETAYQL